eukprot:287825-Prymnesium_polylepis.1
MLDTKWLAPEQSRVGANLQSSVHMGIELELGQRQHLVPIRVPVESLHAGFGGAVGGGVVGKDGHVTVAEELGGGALEVVDERRTVVRDHRQRETEYAEYSSHQGLYGLVAGGTGDGDVEGEP